MAAVASSILASPASSLGSMASRTQWRMRSSMRPRPTPWREHQAAVGDVEKELLASGDRRPDAKLEPDPY
jgi:hypothetical protein